MLGDTAELVLNKYEAFPYADKRVLHAARRLHLPGDGKELSKLVRRKDFARLTAALIRTALDKDYDEMFAQAAS